ncbi:SgcJ/EcaC family oxidoreductase [Dactylosporangium sp. NPDC000555]|uniref:SgcJ/EcaC family oxidoreductase n=1 Tax=Dactylosporangium sp. NPDC000555 TaxID=3154260 RepID=UPI003321FEE2
MTKEAAALVEGAKQWATYYGEYSNGPEGHALTAQLRARAAWAENNADAFADIFIDNGSALFGDTQLKGREEIRGYLVEAFAGPYKATRLFEEPREVRLLTDSSAIIVTDGGLVREGEETVDPANLVRAMWVAVRHDGDWRIVSYQSCPIRN